jgi:hypothetical protein
MKHRLSICFFLMSSLAMLAQEHLGPIDGRPGTPGTVPGSFLINWEDIPDAIGYEYVLTNNELCFANCPGDTRMAVVQSSEAIEYDLMDSTFYFWITRIIYGEGDTSAWTLPSYFLATAPDLSRPVIVTSSTEPGTLRVRLDWSALAAVESVWFEVLDFQGKTVAINKEKIRRQGVGRRFTFETMQAPSVQAGNYILRLWAQSNQGDLTFITRFHYP